MTRKHPTLAEKLAHTLGQLYACSVFGLGKHAEDEMFAQDDDLQDSVEGDPQVEEPTPADELAQVMQQLDVTGDVNPEEGLNELAPTKDKLNRDTIWGNPANVDSGDTATRVTGFDVPTSTGKVF
jgi:hypothetical protein